MNILLYLLTFNFMLVCSKLAAIQKRSGNISNISASSKNVSFLPTYLAHWKKKLIWEHQEGG